MKNMIDTTFTVRHQQIHLIQNGKLMPSKRFTDKSAKDYADRFIEREYRQKVKRINLESTSDYHPTFEDLKGFPRILITGSNAYQKVILLQELILAGFRVEARRQQANVNPITDYSLIKSDEMQSEEIAAIREAGVADYRDYVNEFNLAREDAIKSLQTSVKARKEISDRNHAELVAEKAREDDLLDELLKEIN
ncbi:hypothetical protein [Photobacterium salinisoli]|uniref:hypothetical protein n=1 Tax=Photobacterium salinisoli TaxID=1616783 RepID=UPI000EA3DB5A|nr:hypothetical protein [Photobacterium salinisoli]